VAVAVLLLVVIRGVLVAVEALVTVEVIDVAQAFQLTLVAVQQTAAQAAEAARHLVLEVKMVVRVAQEL
jgi:hypothetical protein